MADDGDDFVAMVEAEARQAVQDALAAGADAPDDDLLAAAEAVARENDISKFDFMEFQSALLDRGFTRDEASAAWEALRDRGGAIREDGQHPRSAEASADPETPASMAEPDDILLVAEETESTEIVMQALAEPIRAGEVAPVEVTSEPGQALTAALDGTVTVPCHVTQADGSPRRGDLEQLLAEHAT